MKISLNILVLNWRDPLHSEAGGAEVHLDRLLSHLALKHKITLVSTRVSFQKETFTYHGYQIKRWGHPFLFNFTFRFLWKKIFSKEDFDLVIDDISKIGLQTPLYIKNVPIVSIFHHVHGHTLFQLLPFPLSLYVYTMEKIALRSYINTPMIVVSESSKQELLHLANFTNITILPNGIDEEYLTIRNPQKTPFQCCSIGRLTIAKRIDLSLELFALILKKFPHAVFLIAGKGKDEERLKTYAQKLNIAHAVTFLGYISEKEKRALLDSSEALLFTSEKEGWGITAIEASASFTPVFGFDVPGIRDAVQQGINGYLVPFPNIAQLAEILTQYLEDSHKKELQGRAYCYAKNFSWNKIAQEFECYLFNHLTF